LVTRNFREVNEIKLLRGGVPHYAAHQFGSKGEHFWAWLECSNWLSFICMKKD